MTAITAAATKTMSVRRATRLRFGLNPMSTSIAARPRRRVRPGRDRAAVPSLAVARTNRLFLLVGAALTVWYVVVLVWALRPLSDAVPIGLDAENRPVSQTVECHDLFAATASDGSLPVVVAPNEYTRGACETVQRNARLVFGIDTAAFVLGLAVLVVIRRRALRLAADEPTVAVPA